MANLTRSAARVGYLAACYDLDTGRCPALPFVLDTLHLLELTGTPCPPEPLCSELMAAARLAYEEAIRDEIDDLDAAGDEEALLLYANNEEPETVDFGGWFSDSREKQAALWGRFVAGMDPALIHLLRPVATRKRWSPAQCCAAYARLVGPISAGSVFLGDAK